jgi:hypothetical protein
MQALPLLALWLARPAERGRQAVSEGALVVLAASGVLITLWLMP